MSRPRAWLCDFDGTVSPTDIGAAFTLNFSRGRDAEREALLAEWREGGLGHRDLTIRECGLIRATEREARAFADAFALDPHFAPFARAALARGERVMVVSEGFGFYVAGHLARAGLAGIPAATNDVRFDGDRLTPVFPWAADGCGACGNCKAQHVRAMHRDGFRTVLVGDGYSDRCGARAADEVLARGALLEWCGAQGIAAAPFQDFAEVDAYARRVAASAPGGSAA